MEIKLYTQEELTKLKHVIPTKETTRLITELESDMFEIFGDWNYEDSKTTSWVGTWDGNYFCVARLEKEGEFAITAETADKVEWLKKQIWGEVCKIMYRNMPEKELLTKEVQEEIAWLKSEGVII